MSRFVLPALGQRVWLSSFFRSLHYILLMYICSYVSGPENSPAPVGLKVWKTIPFVEDTLVSGTEAVKLIP